ncbi:hypothetical protein EUX98_g807 [Antrodiella citrinella]|uniref:Acyl-coenzyme A oxidase n=1 Tax=Antrodiella citrinella TaxID=2447956 RepID=A0A4S4N628_9APHY|nr:hypothetical protein EUX98_g807 [Antrodiella citrinella]
MKVARARFHLSVDLLRDYLHGSHDEWEKHHSLVDLLSLDPVFDKKLRPFMSRSEQYKRTLKLVSRLLELKDQYKWTPKEYATAEGLLGEPLPFALHTAAFAPVFFSQGSPRLVEKYGQLIANRGILGCYIQTELGHGSNVTGLETTAVYLPKTQEFEIHSPTLTSTKCIVMSQGWIIAKAITIAVRYATVRRQGNTNQDESERQIITYPSVYYRLLPILSRAYVFILMGRKIAAMFAPLSKRVEEGDTSPLAEMHAISSGLKSLTTTVAIQDVETTRRALGGHGFSEFAGLGRIYADNVPSTTYEGDNFVLDQQVSRAAVKAFQAFASVSTPSTNSTPPLTPSNFYLRTLSSSNHDGTSLPSRHTLIDSASPKTLVDVLEKRAACVVRQHVATLHDSDASIEQRVARAVMDAFVARQALEILEGAESALGPEEVAALTNLLTLYLLTTIETALVDVLSFHILSSTTNEDPTVQIRRSIRDICLNLLPQAVGLTDAFGFTDWELDSSLGRFDGNVYESLWERAQMEPLNQSEVPDGYEDFLKPILQRGQRLSSGRAKL